MPQGSTNDVAGPYRLGDAYRIFERVERLERSCAALEAAAGRQEVRLGALEVGFSKHLDLASIDADRAAESAQKTLSVVNSLRDDINTIKAQRGSISVLMLLQVSGVLVGVAGVFFSIAKLS